MFEINNNNTAWEEKWPAPAKLNLMLRITGRRDDGYHLLQTVFQIIDLCDWLRFSQEDSDKVSLKNPIAGVPEAEDLMVRAAKLLQSKTGYQGGVQIEIEKNLPMGGGLGGGSSDAATTLLVLNKLWGLGLSVQQLMQLGVSLGADVPVFVYGHTAWAEGVGEVLEKKPLSGQWFVIVKPACHVSTQAIFADPNLTRDSKSITMADFLSGQYKNDCLDVVTRLYEPVAEMLAELSRFGEPRLTGTGACVFVQFEEEAAAKTAFKNLQGCREVFLAKGLDMSPLQKKLAVC